MSEQKCSTSAAPAGYGFLDAPPQPVEWEEAEPIVGRPWTVEEFSELGEPLDRCATYSETFDLLREAGFALARLRDVAIWAEHDPVDEDALDVTVEQYAEAHARWTDLQTQIEQARAEAAAKAAQADEKRQQRAALVAIWDDHARPDEERQRAADELLAGSIWVETDEARARFAERLQIIASVPRLQALQAQVDATYEAGGDWGAAMDALDAEVARCRVIRPGDPGWAEALAKYRGEPATADTGEVGAGGLALRSAAALDGFEHISPGNLDKTEDQFALAIERNYAPMLRYVHGVGVWRIWTGKRWVDDRTRAVRDLVRRVVRAGNIDGAAAVGKLGFTNGVEAFMQASRAFATVADEWDTDPMMLGTPSGVLDLKTGQLWEPDPSLLISKSVAVDPADPGAQAPRWMAFLNEATGADAELIGYLQRVLGYALTGKTVEHLLVFIYGEGGNGKGVFLDAVRGVFGEYGQAADVAMFTRQKHEGHPTDRAALIGARLVTASETERGHQWAEARLKSLTGGDPIRARFMRQDEIQFDPQFQLLIVGNHKPTLSTIDDAMRRRLALIEFNRKPAVVNPALPEELRAEYPAILRWMLDGCLAWQRDGLGARPASVVAATERYFDEQDTVGNWLGERCDVGATFKESGSVLFRDWTDYCRTVGADPGTLSSFGTTLDRRGFDVRKSHGTKVRVGLRLKPFGDGPALGGENSGETNDGQRESLL
jgi:putative DNA primase/helicase